MSSANLTAQDQPRPAFDSSAYAVRIDKTNKQTMRDTMTAVATSARTDAATLDAEAKNLRAQAAALSGKERISGATEALLQEAAGREKDAESRLGLAAAYEQAATLITVTAEQSKASSADAHGHAKSTAEKVPGTAAKPPSGLPHGELKVVEVLTPGTRAAVDLVQDADGRVAIRKIFHPDDTDRADREVAAAAVANAVGITDLEVRRVDPSTVLMTYFEGKTGTELAYAAMSPEDVALLDEDATDAQVENPEWLARWSKADDEYRENLEPWMRAPGTKEIGLFDYLALNIDRNSSNWIVDDDGVVHPIDHDATFIGAIQQQDRLIAFDSPFMRAWLAKDSTRSGHMRPDALASPFSRSHLEQVMERLEDAKPALDKIPPVRGVGVSTYDLVRQRLAWLIEACDTTA